MYCTWKDTRGARFYICPTRQPKETLDIGSVVYANFSAAKKQN